MLYNCFKYNDINKKFQIKIKQFWKMTMFFLYHLYFFKVIFYFFKQKSVE